MKRILVVDDNKAIQSLYAEELAEEGYEVLTSGCDPQLMELIAQQRPDLIVMDIRLDGCNGMDLIHDVRETYDDLPVVLSTAYPASTWDFKSVAANYYVEKGSDLSELKLKIAMALESK